MALLGRRNWGKQKTKLSFTKLPDHLWQENLVHNVNHSICSLEIGLLDGGVVNFYATRHTDLELAASYSGWLISIL